MAPLEFTPRIAFSGAISAMTRTSMTVTDQKTGGSPAGSNGRSSVAGGFLRWWLQSWHPIVFLAVVIVLWWLVTAQGWVQPYIIPAPSDTWAAFTENAEYLLQHTWVTTYETLIGFAIAGVAGLLVAVIMVYSKGLEKTFYPVILFAQVIPKIAIAPLFIVWLGFGAAPKILVAVLMALFPVVISGLAGARVLDADVLPIVCIIGVSQLNGTITIWL